MTTNDLYDTVNLNPIMKLHVHLNISIFVIKHGITTSNEQKKKENNMPKMNNLNCNILYIFPFQLSNIFKYCTLSGDGIVQSEST